MSRIKKILISQPAPLMANPYTEVAEKYQVELDYKQFIRVETVATKEFRQQRINPLDYTAIIFTSRTAILHFFTLMKEMRITMPDTMKYYCSSEMSAPYLQKFVNYRKRKVFFSPTGRTEDLVKVIVKHKSEKYLLPVAEEHSAKLSDLLTEAGLDYTKSIMYRTIPRELELEKPLPYDMIIFFSPVGITSLFENVPDFKQKDIIIATVGPKTAQRAEELGLKVNIKSTGSRQDPPMPELLHNFLAEQEG